MSSVLIPLVDALVAAVADSTWHGSGYHSEKAGEAKRALLAAIELERFRPMGDNHHNAEACPYCNPNGWTLQPSHPKISSEPVK